MVGVSPSPGAEFAEGDPFPDQTALDAAINKLAPGDLQAALKPVLDLIAQSADYAEVFDKLAETYPAMDTQQIEETLARALFVADTWGRLSAQTHA